MKLIMQATGETTIENMNRDATLAFTSKTKAMVKSLTGSESTDGSGASDSGSQGGNGTTNSGGDNQGGSSNGGDDTGGNDDNEGGGGTGGDEA